jgi:hypothetical protein
MIIEAKDGQNIMDVTIQEFGDIENFFDILTDNDLSIDSYIQGGQQITANTTGEGEEEVKEFYINNNIKPKNNQGDNLPPLMAGAYSNDYSNDYS